MSSFISERLSYWAAKAPSRPALVSGNGASMTYAQLDRKTKDYAEAWGLRPYELTAMSFPHAVPGAVAVLSTLRAGAVGLIFSYRETKAERAKKLEKFGPGITLSGLEAKDSGVKVLAHPELAQKKIRWTLLTSGTTGESKAVMMDDENLRARAIGEIELFGIEAGDRIMNWLTFGHDLGLNQILTSVTAGATLVVSSMYSTAEVVRQLEIAPTAGFTATPAMWREYFNSPALAKKISCRYVTCSGGSLSSRELDRLREIATRVILTYGQTETFRSLASEGGPANGLGQAVKDVQLQLSAEGELSHSGAGVMAGYLGEDSGRKMNGGVVHTGDFFRVDPSGNYHFEGRRDDLIKRHDLRMSVKEIENEIRELPGVADVAVLNSESPDGEDALVAFVSSKPGTPISKTELYMHCREQLSGYKVPDGIVILPDLPRTDVGKVNVARLRDGFLKGQLK